VESPYTQKQKIEDVAFNLQKLSDYMILLILDRKKSRAICLDFFHEISELACTNNFLNSSECLNFRSVVFGNLELLMNGEILVLLLCLWSSDPRSKSYVIIKDKFSTHNTINTKKK
jgi:hypothetical protein